MQIRVNRMFNLKLEKMKEEIKTASAISICKTTLMNLFLDTTHVNAQKIIVLI